MRQTPLLLAALLLLASPAVRADTVDASSTTFLTLGPQTEYRGGTKPEVVTVAPVYEILSLTARDVSTSFADDVQAVLSTWGAIDLGNVRWDSGTTSKFSGDVTTGYLQARLLTEHLLLRVGRSSVPTGIARMIQIDGGYAQADVPAGPVEVKVSGYAGSPTSQRFQSRSNVTSWNPTGGTLAYGGRAAFSVPMSGAPGRGLELGASYNEVKDHEDLVRQEVGGDFRLQPGALGNLALVGFTSYDLYDSAFSEASVALTASASPKLHVTADWRYVEPSLLLSRTSILSVFSDSTWNEFGGGVAYDFGRAVHGGLDAHLRIEPGAESGNHVGADLAARLEREAGDNKIGAELSWLNTVENGYVGARLFGRRDFGRTFLSGDLMAQFFRAQVNGQSAAMTANVSTGVTLTHGFSTVLSGTAAATPYMQSAFELLAKIAYNQTYKTEEVR